MIFCQDITQFLPLLTNGGIVGVLIVISYLLFQYIKELNKELKQQRDSFDSRLDKVLQHQKTEFDRQIDLMKEELTEERELTKNMFEKTISRLEKYDGWFGDMVKVFLSKDKQDKNKSDSS